MFRSSTHEGYLLVEIVSENKTRRFLNRDINKLILFIPINFKASKMNTDKTFPLPSAARLNFRNSQSATQQFHTTHTHLDNLATSILFFFDDFEHERRKQFKHTGGTIEKIVVLNVKDDFIKF